MRRLVWIGHTATVYQALQQMRQYDITALPVYNNETKSFLGIVDIRIILYFFIWAKFQCNIEKLEFNKDITKNIDIPSTPVTDLLTSSETTRKWLFIGDESMANAFEVMGQGLHRAIVSLIEPEGVVQRMMSQTDMVQWIALNKHVFGNALNMSLLQLEFIHNGEVVSMFSDETALEGFKRMIQQRLWSIAVVQREVCVIIGQFINALIVQFMHTDEEAPWVSFSF